MEKTPPPFKRAITPQERQQFTDEVDALVKKHLLKPNEWLFEFNVYRLDTYFQQLRIALLDNTPPVWKKIQRQWPQHSNTALLVNILALTTVSSNRHSWVRQSLNHESFKLALLADGIKQNDPVFVKSLRVIFSRQKDTLFYGAFYREIAQLIIEPGGVDASAKGSSIRFPEEACNSNGGKLRLALANAYHRKLGAAKVLNIAIYFSGVSEWVRIRELNKYLAETATDSNTAPLKRSELWRFNQRELSFLHKHLALTACFLNITDAAGITRLGKRLEQQEKLRPLVDENLRQFNHAFAQRDFRAAESRLQTLIDLNPPIQWVRKGLFITVKDSLERYPSQGDSIEKNTPPFKWQALSPSAFRYLARAFGSKRSRHYWALSASEVLGCLLEQSLQEETLTAIEKRLLQRSWEQHDWQRIFEAKRFTLFSHNSGFWTNGPLEQCLIACLYTGKGTSTLALRATAEQAEILVLELLAKHREASHTQSLLLALPHTWHLPFFGQAIWNRVADVLLSSKLLFGLVTHALDGQAICDCSSYLQGIERLIKDSNQEISLGLMNNISVLLDTPLPVLFAQLPASSARRLLHRESLMASLHPALLSNLKQLQHPELPREVWELQFRHASTWEERQDLLLKPESTLKPIELPKEWIDAAGNNVDHVAILLIALRQHGKAFKKLLQHYPEEVATLALEKAQFITAPVYPRDAVLFELTRVLGLDLYNTLVFLQTNRAHQKPCGGKFDHLYTTFDIPKKSGGTRRISSPQPLLKTVQHRIYQRLLQPLVNHPAAHGFVPGVSIVDNAAHHTGQSVVVNVDIKACFPSVRWSYVLGALKRDLQTTLSPRAIRFVADICCANGALPIGAPTSPALLNRVLYKTDEILTRHADAKGCTYTRYADDLTFSGGEDAVSLIGVSKSVLKPLGLALDPKKTNVYRQGRRQLVTGLVVNTAVNVPRHTRRLIRAAIHAGANAHLGGKPVNRAQLQGHLAFLQSVNPNHASVLRTQLATSKVRA